MPQNYSADMQCLHIHKGNAHVVGEQGFDLTRSLLPGGPLPRVLFGSAGWPSGMLEVATYSARERISRPLIAPLRPYVLAQGKIHPEFELREGPIPLRDLLALMNSPARISRHSYIKRSGNEWVIRDPVLHRTFVLQVEGQWLRLIDPRRYNPARARHILEERAARGRKDLSPLLLKSGAIHAEAEKAFMSLGMDFAKRVLNFSPHVVGFRLEAGEMKRLTGRVAAIQLLSEAFVIIGGPAATTHPREVLEQSGADFVLAGEAEQSFSDLMSVLGCNNRETGLTDSQYERLLSIRGLTGFVWKLSVARLLSPFASQSSIYLTARG